MSNKKNITVSIDFDTYKKTKKICIDRGVTIANHVEQALIKYNAEVSND